MTGGFFYVINSSMAIEKKGAKAMGTHVVAIKVKGQWVHYAVEASTRADAVKRARRRAMQEYPRG